RLDEALRLYDGIPDAAPQAARLRAAIQTRRAEDERRLVWEKAVAVLQRAKPELTATQRAALATEALTLFPEYEQAFVVRAVADQELGDDVGAYEDLGRAARVSANPLVHLLGRADISRRLGKVDDEIDNLSAALELNPLSSNLRVYRAWALARQARKLAESRTAAGSEQASRALARAEADLSGIKKHSLLETVQAAVRDAQAALKTGY